MFLVSEIKINKERKKPETEIKNLNHVCTFLNQILFKMFAQCYNDIAHLVADFLHHLVHHVQSLFDQTVF